eukprot:760847-Amphidinium_carterae.1
MRSNQQGQECAIMPMHATRNAMALCSFPSSSDIHDLSQYHYSKLLPIYFKKDNSTGLDGCDVLALFCSQTQFPTYFHFSS